MVFPLSAIVELITAPAILASVDIAYIKSLALVFNPSAKTIP
jgi:hypothetical protein